MDVGAVQHVGRDKCGICGKPGHSARDCWWRNNPKGGKPDSKGGKSGWFGGGKGKDDKGKGKDSGKKGGKTGWQGGGGKGFQGYCRNCGAWGHKKEECPRLAQSVRDKKVHALAMQALASMSGSPGSPSAASSSAGASLCRLALPCHGMRTNVKMEF